MSIIARSLDESERAAPASRSAKEQHNESQKQQQQEEKETTSDSAYAKKKIRPTKTKEYHKEYVLIWDIFSNSLRIIFAFKSTLNVCLCTFACTRLYVGCMLFYRSFHSFVRCFVCIVVVVSSLLLLLLFFFLERMSSSVCIVGVVVCLSCYATYPNLPERKKQQQQQREKNIRIIGNEMCSILADISTQVSVCVFTSANRCTYVWRNDLATIIHHVFVFGSLQRTRSILRNLSHKTS